MSRIFQESNAAQAMREVTHSFSVPIIFGLGLYVMETFDEDVGGTVFMIVTAVLLHMASKEIAWLVKIFLFHRSANLGRLKIEPREATIKDYAKWLGLHFGIMVVVFSVLFYVLIGLEGKRFDANFPILSGFAIALGIAATTGDALSGGLIGGFEVWSLYMLEDQTERFKIVLIVTGSLATLLSLHHGVRTILAVSYLDKSYLRNLKNVRWGWDASSEEAAHGEDEDDIMVLATTSIQRPFYSDYKDIQTEDSSNVGTE